METIQFDKTTDAKECVDIVKRTGAVLLRGYVATGLRVNILKEHAKRPKSAVDEREHNVRQQFETINYRFPDEATPTTYIFGQELLAFMSQAVPRWKPNDTAIQYYHPSQTVGIDPHRDYARDRLLVAVATLTGKADFHIELDEDNGKKWSKRKLEPGDLVLLRAPGLTGAEEDRPYHRIDPPTRDPRVSLALRHNNRLETKIKEGGNHGNS